MSNTSGVVMGPFKLHQQIGRGGMSVVYSATHVAQDVPVAVKVMTEVEARHQLFVNAFENEVRSVAALDHPGIIMIVDHGRVTDAAAEHSGGTFTAGSPYLAMELASGGTLSRVSEDLPWPKVKSILQSLLHALAHAHARGVVHRDLKPSNILQCTSIDVRPGLKVTDFGLATAVADQDRKGNVEKAVGSPNYMAPEQLRGRWRDFGPWTDLFALGCMAFRMVTGKRPWPPGSTPEILRARLETPPVAFEPRIEVPRGLERWLGKLLSKDIEGRYQHAADAADVLRLIDEHSGSPLKAARAPGDPEPETAAIAEVDPTTAPDSSAVVPAVPDSWQQDQTTPRSFRLLGAGLGLFAVRDVPMVGRDSERDTIWNTLRFVHETRQPRLIVLRGPAGYGKSRMSRWLAERAAELGSAAVVSAIHSPIIGPTDGLEPMIARHHRLVGLTREQTYARLQAVLPADGDGNLEEAAALTDLLFPQPRGQARSSGSIMVGSRESRRYAVVLHWLRRLSERRPLVLRLDDVQWGADALGFAQKLLASPGPLPVLILCTVRDEALTERTVETHLIEDLLKLDSAAALEIGPLPGEAQTELLERLLTLSGDLSKRVVERTGGNPMFAMQLVGGWVESGLLEMGPSGFRLRPAASIELPDDLHQVWQERLTRLLSSQPDDSVQALEIAAVLGMEVKEDEWRFACRHADLDLDPTQLDALVSSLTASCLAKPIADGWAFAHGMVRESLERAARDGERWRRHHDACARMLDALYAAEQPGKAERLGLHLVAAGELARAAEPLLHGAVERFSASELRIAELLLSTREETLAALPAAAGDRRWGDGWVLRARTAQSKGDLQAAQTWAQKTEQAGLRYGWRDLIPETQVVLGQVAQRLGNHEDAQRYYERAVASFSATSDAMGLSTCLRELGYIAQQRGALDDADALLERAKKMAESAGDMHGVATTMQRLGLLARQRGQLGIATTHLEQSLAVFKRIGNQMGVAGSLNALGDVARFEGDLDEAAARYRSADELSRALGAGNELVSSLNQAFLALARRHYADAEKLARDAAVTLEARGQRGALACVHALLMASSAHTRAWDDMDAHHAKAMSLMAKTSFLDADAAWPAKLAGDLATLAGERSRAMRAYALAHQQWAGLGNKKEAADTMSAMTALNRS